MYDNKICAIFKLFGKISIRREIENKLNRNSKVDFKSWDGCRSLKDDIISSRL